MAEHFRIPADFDPEMTWGCPVRRAVVFYPAGGCLSVDNKRWSSARSVSKALPLVDLGWSLINRVNLVNWRWLAVSQHLVGLLLLSKAENLEIRTGNALITGSSRMVALWYLLCILAECLWLSHRIIKHYFKLFCSCWLKVWDIAPTSWREMHRIGWTFHEHYLINQTSFKSKSKFWYF